MKIIGSGILKGGGGGGGGDEGLTERVNQLETDAKGLQAKKADKDLENISIEDFFAKGIQSGLSGGSGELQNRIDMFVVSYSNNVVVLSATKPSTSVVIPFSLSTSGSELTFKFVYDDVGIISPFSVFDLVLCAGGIPTNSDISFVATISANVNKTNVPIGISRYTNRYSIANPRMEIPIENNNLTKNIDRKAGDFLQVVLNIRKMSGGSPSAISFFSNKELDSKLVRNGGDISSTNVFDFNGTTTTSVSARLRSTEELIEKKQNNITGSATSILYNNLPKEIVLGTDSSGKVKETSVSTKSLSEYGKSITDILSNIETMNGTISDLTKQVEALQKENLLQKEEIDKARIIHFVSPTQISEVIKLESGFSISSTSWRCFIQNGLIYLKAYVSCPTVGGSSWKNCGRFVKKFHPELISAFADRTTSSIYTSTLGRGIDGMPPEDVVVYRNEQYSDGTQEKGLVNPDDPSISTEESIKRMEERNLRASGYITTVTEVTISGVIRVFASGGMSAGDGYNLEFMVPIEF
ncbi:MAG: hypothetical protein ACRCZB_05155 [Bacteroidales bacterium]